MDQVGLGLTAIFLNTGNTDISHQAQIIVLTFYKKIIYLSYVYECFTYMYVSMLQLLQLFNECRDQLRAMDPLELALNGVVSHYMCARKVL